MKLANKRRNERGLMLSDSRHTLGSDPVCSDGYHLSWPLQNPGGRTYRWAIYCSSCTWMQFLAGSDDKKWKTEIHTHTTLTSVWRWGLFKIFTWIHSVWSRSECSWLFQTCYINFCLTVAHYIHLLINLPVSLATDIIGQLNIDRW